MIKIPLLIIALWACSCTSQIEWNIKALEKDDNAEFKELLERNSLPMDLMIWRHEGSSSKLPIDDLAVLDEGVVIIGLEKNVGPTMGYDVIRVMLFHRNGKFLDMLTCYISKNYAYVSFHVENREGAIAVSGGLGFESVDLVVDHGGEVRSNWGHVTTKLV